MALDIETFSNVKGGATCFKALGHPLVAGAALAARIRSAEAAFAYDPLGCLAEFAALHGLRSSDLRGCFVRDTLALEGSTLGHAHRPLTELPGSGAQLLFLAAFDAAQEAGRIAGLLPPGCRVLTLDEMRLPERLLTDRRHYLAKLNFATNFAFFRDAGGCCTRLVTANYWGGYGARNTFLWCRLFGARGETLADFEVPLGRPGESVVIDSRELRAAHGLPEFHGQLFLSVVNGAGHDLVKYVLDVGDAETDLSCTHDANAWPAELYAGLPAPAAGETVTLWVQNSHPRAIPPREIGLNLMGDDRIVRLDEEIPPFATCALDVSTLLPEARWPQQVEIQAGKWFVRPRYEVLRKQHRRINHLNVERTDLRHDEAIRRVAPHVGKGFLLPAPLLPAADYACECLPTPMATAQLTLPLVVAIHDADGREVAHRKLGSMPRAHCRLSDLHELAGALPSGYGHVELCYDLEQQDGVLDGWIHALFRYTDRHSGHAAETSFGSHIYNHFMIFRNEPQVLSRTAAGALHAPVPAPGAGPGPHFLSPDLPGITPVAEQQRNPAGTEKPRRRGRRNTHTLHSGRRLAPVHDRRVVLRRCPAPRGRTCPHPDPRHHLPAVRLSRPAPGRRFRTGSHVRILRLRRPAREPGQRLLLSPGRDGPRGQSGRGPA